MYVCMYICMYIYIYIYIYILYEGDYYICCTCGYQRNSSLKNI